MQIESILSELVGTSPFVGFLIWYILSERKTKQDDKEYHRRKSDEREDSLKDLLLKNHEIITSNQKVMEKLSDKYSELKEVVQKGFDETTKDIKTLYKNINCKSRSDEGGN